MTNTLHPYAKFFRSCFPAVSGNIASEKVMLEAKPERAKMAVFAIPHAPEAGEAIARLKALNPAITELTRATSDTEVRHLLEHGDDAARLTERERASSRDGVVRAQPRDCQRRRRPEPITNGT